MGGYQVKKKILFYTVYFPLLGRLFEHFFPFSMYDEKLKKKKVYIRKRKIKIINKTKMVPKMRKEKNFKNHTV